MAFGVEVVSPAGQSSVNMAMPGGRIFVGMVVRAKETAGIVTVYTFPDIPGHTFMKVKQVTGGAHIWAVGTNGLGQAIITLTAKNPRPVSFVIIPDTRLAVFATRTTEPDYGLEFVNDAGERTVSTIRPTADFIGKITFGGAVTAASELGYTRYSHSISTSLGSGRHRMVLWSVPSTASDVWFTGTSYIPSSVSGAYNVVAQYYCAAGTPYTLPEAFVFAMGGASQSADAYGLRVYSAAGELMYDAGHQHLVVKAFESISFPNSGVAYTSMASFAGITPAFFLPDYVSEVWTSGSGISNAVVRKGVVRRDGTGFGTRSLKVDQYSEDVVISGTYDWGLQTNLPAVVVDAVSYGGTPFA